jgi:TPR repeat protein
MRRRATFRTARRRLSAFVLYQDFLIGVEIDMSYETKRELVRPDAPSELLAPGSTDAPTLSAQQIMALLRESLAKQAQRSDSEIQAELTSLRRLAAHGNIDAQKNLGFLYYCGQDVPQDYAQAAHWYRKAADEGDYLAQFELGEMYRHGLGLPQDYAQSVDWLRKSAEQGFDEAAWSLAEMSSLGQGVPHEDGEAAR